MVLPSKTQVTGKHLEPSHRVAGKSTRQDGSENPQDTVTGKPCQAQPFTRPLLSRFWMPTLVRPPGAPSILSSSLQISDSDNALSLWNSAERWHCHLCGFDDLPLLLGHLMEVTRLDDTCAPYSLATTQMNQG